MADLQEVQTAVDITPENTLETIEAIWTSSRKIIIGRQTRWIVQWWSWLSMQNSVYLVMHAWDETDDLIWTLTVFDTYWDLFYAIMKLLKFLVTTSSFQRVLQKFKIIFVPELQF